MANNFRNNNTHGGTGRINKSGFRFNIAKNCRLTAADAEGLSAYREGHDRIFGPKKKKDKEA